MATPILTVVLDNWTIESSMMALDPKQPFHMYYDPIAVEKAGIWALSNLVEAIILWNRIIVRAEKASRWRRHSEQILGTEVNSLIETLHFEEDPQTLLLKQELSAEVFHEFIDQHLDRYGEGSQHLFESLLRGQNTQYPWNSATSLNTAIDVIDYWIFSEEHQYPYYPHPVRTFALYHLLAYLNKQSILSPRFFVSLTEDLRSERIKCINNYFGKDFYTLNLPSLLSIIIKQSKSIDEIIPNALQLRREASQFRVFFAELLNMIDQEKIRLITELIDELENMKVVSRELKLDLELQIGISPSLVVKKEVHLPKIRRFRRKLVFLQNVMKKSFEIGDIQKDISRLWDSV